MCRLPTRSFRLPCKTSQMSVRPNLSKVSSAERQLIELSFAAIVTLCPMWSLLCLWCVSLPSKSFEFAFIIAFSLSEAINKLTA